MKKHLRKLFIDCGGHDGCSAIKFKLLNPEYSIISFEPNPAFWGYYNDIPSKLIKSAAYTFDGKLEFYLDEIDGDGSTVEPTKKIDSTNKINNTQCKSIEVECIDLAKFITSASKNYAIIELKLDIEGAEYKVIEHLIKTKAIKFLRKIYCEFHSDRMNPKDDNTCNIERNIKKIINTEFWDALDYSIHKQNSTKLKRIREDLIRSIKINSKIIRK